MTDLRAQLQGTLGDAYTIERELGGGGMSRVFLAVERSLGRQVVIKMLPAEMAGAVSIERFKREIALAARLQQANIVPILSAGDADGVPWFTMPFVEGRSLRARLASGALPVNEAVSVLKEVARALAYAHAQQVVHRDIKPDNILLSGGTAMVTDFGVAKALTAATMDSGNSLTATGLAIGTPAYMAPEQALGDPAVDHRADVYGFGCLAYEILTGSPPFAGRSAQQLVAAHHTETPEPIDRRRVEVPAPLARLVDRCLAKDPAARPQRTQELIETLDALAAPTAGGMFPFSLGRNQFRWLAAAAIVVAATAFTILQTRGPRAAVTQSLAVLPIVNATHDTAYDFLADGLTDEIHAQLTRVGHLTVRGQQSANVFRGANIDVHDAAKRLQVDNLVQGTMTLSGRRAHLAIDIVRASDGTSLWSGTYDPSVTEFYAVRDSIASSVARALTLKFGASTGRRTSDPIALEYILRGRFEMAKSQESNYHHAIKLFEAALQRDPQSAEAYAGIAWTQTFLADAYVAPVVAYTDAEAAAKRALAIDSTNADAHITMGMVHAFRDWNFARADSEFARAQHYNPQRAEALSTRAVALLFAGRPDDAVREAALAVRVDPLSVFARTQQSWCLVLAGRYREGIDAYNAALALDPTFFYGWSMQGIAYRGLGRVDSAALVVARDAHLAGGAPLPDVVETYAMQGRMADARAELARIEELARHSYIIESTIAAAYASVGDRTRAFQWLNRVFESRSALWQTLRYLKEWQPLMSDPRWADFLKRAEAARR